MTDLDEDVREQGAFEDLAAAEQAHAELVRAIGIINTQLAREARRRGWCSSYEAWCAETNQLIGQDLMIPCKQMVTVTLAYEAPRYWEPAGLHHDLHEAILRHAGDYAEGVGDISIGVAVDGDLASEPG